MNENGSNVLPLKFTEILRIVYHWLMFFQICTICAAISKFVTELESNLNQLHK